LHDDHVNGTAKPSTGPSYGIVQFIPVRSSDDKKVNIHGPWTRLSVEASSPGAEDRGRVDAIYCSQLLPDDVGGTQNDSNEIAQRRVKGGALISLDKLGVAYPAAADNRGLFQLADFARHGTAVGLRGSGKLGYRTFAASDIQSL
jgi:hypothetical protein